MPYFGEICGKVVSGAWKSPFMILFNKALLWISVAENQKCQANFSESKPVEISFYGIKSFKVFLWHIWDNTFKAYVNNVL
jgi:hypothetical protein